jgi:hypothetical protein
VAACSGYRGDDQRARFVEELAAVEGAVDTLNVARTRTTCADVPIFVLSWDEIQDECGDETAGCYVEGVIGDEEHISVVDFRDEWKTKALLAHEFTHCVIRQYEHGGMFCAVAHQALTDMGGWISGDGDCE